MLVEKLSNQHRLIVEMTWQPPGHGAKGRRAKAVAAVRHPDEAAALMRELDVLAAQVSATWVGCQDAVDAVRDQRRG